MTVSELIKETNSIFSIVNKYLSDNEIKIDPNIQKEIVYMIKKESPISPYSQMEQYCDDKEYFCPKCNFAFGEDNFNYCPDCGQKISWKGI